MERVRKISVLKNPFAIKGERTIMIGDLSNDERGSKCGCICPNCKASFVARMGDINTHHFAHGMESCDEVKAYMLGIYSLLYQSLLEDRSFSIPSLVIKYYIPVAKKLTEESIVEYIRLSNNALAADNKKILFQEQSIRVDNAIICMNKKDIIIAIVVTVNRKKLAIKILPPRTICKSPEVSAYEDLPTIAIDFSQHGTNLNSLTTKQFKQLVIRETSMKYWVYNPLLDRTYPTWKDNPTVKKAFLEIIEQSEKIYELYVKQKQQVRMEHPFVNEKQFSYIPYTSCQKSKEQFSKKEMHEKGYKEVVNKFDIEMQSILLDRFGKRWVKCKVCNEIKRDDDMSIYGGKDHINFGTCTECMRKKNYS